MATETKKSVFATLSKINVDKFTEQKNGLTYLSWAWAWATLKENYPNATYTIYEDAEGKNYHTDGKTAWVKTGVTVEGLEMIEYLPVMDFKNKSIPVGNITSFEVNKTIQRSLTKAIARHGLGLYLYYKCDDSLPEEEPKPTEEKISKDLEKKVNAICIKHGNLDKILGYYKIKTLSELTKAQAETIVRKAQEKEKAEEKEKK